MENVLFGNPQFLYNINVASLQEHISAAILCLPRLIGISIFVPFLRTQFLPGIVRNALLFSLAVFISPQILAINELPTEQTAWFFLAAKEAGVGVVMGMVVGLSFLVPQIIGDFIDNQRGTSIAQVFNPAAGGDTSILGTFLSLFITTLFLASGGFILFLEILFESYRILGVHELVPSAKVDVMLDALITIFTKMIAIGVLLAAPVVLVMMLAEFSLGLMGRFVQQLQVFFLAMPIKSLLGFSMLFVYILVIVRVYELNELPLGPLRSLIDTFSSHA